MTSDLILRDEAPSFLPKHEFSGSAKPFLPFAEQSGLPLLAEPLSNAEGSSQLFKSDPPLFWHVIMMNNMVNFNPLFQKKNISHQLIRNGNKKAHRFLH
jgi:hypothetical protein